MWRVLLSLVAGIDYRDAMKSWMYIVLATRV